jgi:hypothetical protein
MNKTLMYVLIAIAVYYIFFSGKEGFALSTGTITDRTQIENTKFYKIGKRKVDKTETPSQFGGKDCGDNYPDIAYQLVPPVDAKCKGDNVDTNYEWEPTPKRGDEINPTIRRFTSNFAFIRNNATGKCWNVLGGLGEGNKLGQYGGGSGNCDGSENSKFKWDGRNISAGDKGCIYTAGNQANNDTEIIFSTRCRNPDTENNGVNYWYWTGNDGVFRYSNTNKCITVFGGDKNEDTKLVLYDCKADPRGESQGWVVKSGPGVNDGNFNLAQG